MCYVSDTNSFDDSYDYKTEKPGLIEQLKNKKKEYKEHKEYKQYKKQRKKEKKERKQHKKQQEININKSTKQLDEANKKIEKQSSNRQDKLERDNILFKPIRGNDFNLYHNINQNQNNPFAAGPIPGLKTEQENRTKFNKQPEKPEKEKTKILDEQPIVQSDVTLDIQPIEIPHTIDENKIQTVQVRIKSCGTVSVQQTKYTPLAPNGQPTMQNVSSDKKWTNNFKPYYNSFIIEPTSEPETEQENSKNRWQHAVNTAKENSNEKLNKMNFNNL